MASYEYKAVKANGDMVEGDMEAPYEATVVLRLQAEGLIPVRAALARKGLRLELSLAGRGGRTIGQ